MQEVYFFAHFYEFFIFPILSQTPPKNAPSEAIWRAISVLYNADRAENKARNLEIGMPN